MRIAILGSGGREHALAWAMSRNPSVGALFVIPGNAGTALVAHNVTDVDICDALSVCHWATRESIDLVVIGPEAPLVAGVADALQECGVAAFGPSAAAARLEGSKAFAKEVMAAAGIATARAEVFTDSARAIDALERFGPPWVIKADGLAAGKGVTVTPDVTVAQEAIRRALVASAPGTSPPPRVLLEEYLEGPEVSLLALSDGVHVLPFAPARDYKRAGTGDVGPNTGGMGAYSPVGDVGPDLVQSVRTGVLEPAIRELARRGTPYRGMLYAGLALTKSGPKVIEFNARFGDPEAQALIPRLTTDLADLLLATARGELTPRTLRWDPRACVSVILAASGYPQSTRTGDVVYGLQEAAEQGALVFHGATSRNPDGQVRTTGGRVLSVSALGHSLGAARAAAYEAAAHITFEGMQFRGDIAEVTSGEGHGS